MSAAACAPPRAQHRRRELEPGRAYLVGVVGPSAPAAVIRRSRAAAAARRCADAREQRRDSFSPAARAIAAYHQPLPAVDAAPSVAVPVHSVVLRVRARSRRSPRRGAAAPGCGSRRLSRCHPLGGSGSIPCPPTCHAARPRSPEESALASSPLDPLYNAIGWLLAFFYAAVQQPRALDHPADVHRHAVQFPLIAKQTRSMIQMQRVQPEIKKIQAKYKDDRQKQNEELLKFYQENKINPLAGCLPMLVHDPDRLRRVPDVLAGLQTHLPQTGLARSALRRLLRQRQTDLHQAAAKRSRRTRPGDGVSGMSLNLSADHGQRLPRTSSRTSSSSGSSCSPVVPGAPDPGPPAAERVTRRRTRRCR